MIAGRSGVLQQLWNKQAHTHTNTLIEVSSSCVPLPFIELFAVVRVIMHNINAPHIDSDADTGIKYTHRVISRKSRLSAVQLATGSSRHLSLSFLEI